MNGQWMAESYKPIQKPSAGMPIKYSVTLT